VCGLWAVDFSSLSFAVKCTLFSTCCIAEEQFARVDARYSEDTQLLRFGAVEDRILSFQRQLEERSRAELNMAVCIID